MDQRRRIATKYLTDEITYATTNNGLFKRLGYSNDQLSEVELVKSEIEYKEPVIVRFFILQYAKLKIPEPH